MKDIPRLERRTLNIQERLRELEEVNEEKDVEIERLQVLLVDLERRTLALEALSND